MTKETRKLTEVVEPSIPTTVSEPVVIATAYPFTIWEQDWLKKIPCSAPCWENIIPGITTAPEAELILRNNPMNHDVKLYPKLTGGYGSIEWKVQKNALGAVIFDPDSNSKIIREIYPPYSDPVKLSDVISAYGVPSHIIATVSTPPDINAPLVYSVIIVFEENGFLLSLVNSPNSKPVLEPDSRFSVRFYIPTKEGFKSVADIDLDNKKVRKWEGYKSFDEYCMDDFDDIYCKGTR